MIKFLILCLSVSQYCNPLFSAFLKYLYELFTGDHKAILKSKTEAMQAIIDKLNQRISKHENVGGECIQLMKGFPDVLIEPKCLNMITFKHKSPQLVARGLLRYFYTEKNSSSTHYLVVVLSPTKESRLQPSMRIFVKLL